MCTATRHLAVRLLQEKCCEQGDDETGPKQKERVAECHDVRLLADAGCDGHDGLVRSDRRIAFTFGVFTLVMRMPVTLLPRACADACCMLNIKSSANRAIVTVPFQRLL